MLKPEAGGCGEFFTLTVLPRVDTAGRHCPQASVSERSISPSLGVVGIHDSHTLTGWHQKHLMSLTLKLSNEPPLSDALSTVADALVVWFLTLITINS